MGITGTFVRLDTSSAEAAGTAVKVGSIVAIEPAAACVVGVVFSGLVTAGEGEGIVVGAGVIAAAGVTVTVRVAVVEL